MDDNVPAGPMGQLMFEMYKSLKGIPKRPRWSEHEKPRTPPRALQLLCFFSAWFSEWFRRCFRDNVVSFWAHFSIILSMKKGIDFLIALGRPFGAFLGRPALENGALAYTKRSFSKNHLFRLGDDF